MRLYLAILTQITSVTNTWTDGQTDKRTTQSTAQLKKTKSQQNENQS